MRIWSLLPLAIALAGCTASEENVKKEQARIALPIGQTLPVGPNTHCECIEGNNCITLEARAGSFEVKGLSCKWTNRRNEAECSYQTRFVAEYAAEDGKLEYFPENWDKQTVIARHLGNDSWCRSKEKA